MMIPQQTLNGMKIIIVVHIVLHLQFCSTYGLQSQKKWKKMPQESNQYISMLHDGFQQYLSGVSTLEAACDSV